MNKILSLTVALAALGLGACSGSTTTGTNSGSGTGSGSGSSSGGSSSGDAGFTTITFADVDMHPAAKAALLAAGVPSSSILSIVPSANSNGPFDAGYVIIVTGISIGPGPSIVTTVLQSIPITSNGPFNYMIYNNNIISQAPLGILSAIQPALPDGGTASAGDGGLAQITCAELAAGIATVLAASPGSDYFFPSGNQVGGTANPPSANVANAAAYAVPMSYAAMLNCAGAPTKTTRDSDQGIALIYVTDGGATTGSTNLPGSGNPLSGVTFTINKDGNAAGMPPVLTYYTGGNYSGTATSSTSATDTTGIATALNVVTASEPPTLTCVDPAADTFFVPGLATELNFVFELFPYQLN